MKKTEKYGDFSSMIVKMLRNVSRFLAHMHYFIPVRDNGKTIVAVTTTVLPLNGMMKHTGNPRVRKEGRGE